MVKMTKCRQMCTPVHVREGVARYPHGRRSKLPLPTAPHLAQREERPDILNGLEITRFLGDYDWNGVLGRGIE